MTDPKEEVESRGWVEGKESMTSYLVDLGK